MTNRQQARLPVFLSQKATYFRTSYEFFLQSLLTGFILILMSATEMILFGILAGSIANLLDPRKEGGFLGPIILGVLGAVLGTVFASMLFNMNFDLGFSDSVVSVVASSIGSFVLLSLSSLLKEEDHKFKIDSNSEQATA